MTIGDFRSDTVTRPVPAMRDAMHAAEVGDDVWGDDPTVSALEAKVAAYLGKEDAVFVPSGTQSNLCGLMAHCDRGDEYIVGQNAHTYRYEGGGAAVLGSIQPQPIEMAADGSLELDRVRAAIKPDDAHFARTRLLCIENTHDGKVIPGEYFDALPAFLDEHGLAAHLDGARLWNAAVASGTKAADIAAPFASVSVCFSKGLGAPVGSALCGPSELVQRARRWRKILGGGMRQSGILAAAAIYAIDHHVERLADDHRRASQIAAGLAAIDGFSVDLEAVQSNMVFVKTDHDPGTWQRALGDNDIVVDAGPSTRLVLHHDIDDGAVDRLLSTSMSLP